MLKLNIGGVKATRQSWSGAVHLAKNSFSFLVGVASEVTRQLECSWYVLERHVEALVSLVQEDCMPGFKEKFVQLTRLMDKIKKFEG